MANPKKNQQDNGKGKQTVEDAAKVLKESKNIPLGAAGAQPEPAKPEEKQEPGQQQPEPGASQDGAQPEPGSQEPAAGSNGGQPGIEPAQPEPAKPEENEVSMPIPDEEDCERFAIQLAKSPAHLQAFRKTLEMADAKVKEMNQPAKKTIEEMETINYQRLVGQYGKDFVIASKGANKSYFSRKTWVAMKNKHGWIEVTKTMPEAEAAKPEEEGK